MLATTPVRPDPCKTPSISRTPKKPPQLYLRKDSSIRSFDHVTGTEWDQDSREKTMDDFFNKFISRINQTGQESFGLKETVELYKTRSKQTPAVFSTGSD